MRKDKKSKFFVENTSKVNRYIFFFYVFLSLVFSYNYLAKHDKNMYNIYHIYEKRVYYGGKEKEYYAVNSLQ